jgi:TPR repeat protein
MARVARTFSSSTFSWPLALVAGATSLLTGCGSADLFPPAFEAGGMRYDAQTCVEHALRNAPDPEGVREATVAFADACNGGEAAACSALGVMYELGRGVAVDERRARQLYGIACDAHNARACANLAALLSTDTKGAHESVASLAE